MLPVPPPTTTGRPEPFVPPDEIVTIDRRPFGVIGPMPNEQLAPGTQLTIRAPAAAVPAGAGIPIGIVVAVAALAFAVLVPKGKVRR